MTLYLSFRSQPVAGGVVYPRLWKDDSAAAGLRPVDTVERERLLAGRDILLVAHGFNVDQNRAMACYAALDAHLNLGDSGTMVGVLWPGDFWIPAINYPFEGSDAMDCGNKLADYCDRFLGQARSLSFLSHSLGARLVLQAVAMLRPPRKARMLCLTAGAINRDCLEGEYRQAAGNAEAIDILASHKDEVLSLAFPVGDALSLLFHDDHTPFQRALGDDGPSRRSVALLRGPHQIPDRYGFRHGSYLPSADPRRWVMVADYVRRAFLGEPQIAPYPFPPP